MSSRRERSPATHPLSHSRALFSDRYWRGKRQKRDDTPKRRSRKCLSVRSDTYKTPTGQLVRSEDRLMENQFNRTLKRERVATKNLSRRVLHAAGVTRGEASAVAGAMHLMRVRGGEAGEQRTPFLSHRSVLRSH